LGDKQFGVRILRWAAANMPTRESMGENRWLRPVAHRVLAPELWRFTRRSVPRGVALGMVTGILIPMGQIPASAVLALPLRANIPAAALTTFFTNPITTPPLWVAAYWVGAWMLRFDAQVPGHPLATHAQVDVGWLDWLLVDAGPATLVGLLLFALVGALLGYFASAFGWRWWIGRKWRRRHRRHIKADDRPLN
jgi:uncharacterized protein (DUF2062 family)